MRFTTDFTSNAVRSRPIADGTGLQAEPDAPFDPELAAELLVSQLWDLGTTGVFREAHDRFVAGFDDEPAAHAAAEHLRRIDGPVSSSISVEPAPSADHWQPDTGPTDVAITAGPDPLTLSIRAGGAFGHGGHQTTRMAIDLLADEIDRRRRAGREIRVFDVGTGTGVLAMTAAALGATSVVAIDHDPDALAVADENISRNRELGLVPANDRCPVMLGRQTVDEIGASLQPFDVVVINILLAAQRQLARAVIATLAEGASLITAGYLAEQETELISLYKDLAVVERVTADDWTAHRFEAGPAA